MNADPRITTRGAPAHPPGRGRIEAADDAAAMNLDRHVRRDHDVDAAEDRADLDRQDGR